jgi:Zn ribbon nucleic-acid-binding protein
MAAVRMASPLLLSIACQDHPLRALSPEEIMDKLEQCVGPKGRKLLAPVICPSCHHTGAIDSARLPRILTCVRCGHSEQFEAPPPNRLTRGQRAAERARELTRRASLSAHCCSPSRTPPSARPPHRG